MNQQQETPSAPPMKPITVKAEWTMVLICAALVVFFEIVGVFSETHPTKPGEWNLFTFMGGITWWLGHALWVSMDRRRRGLEIGAWRFGVVFFGFLAAWLYMIIEYRTKGLLLILASIGIYLVMAFGLGGVIILAAAFK